MDYDVLKIRLLQKEMICIGWCDEDTDDLLGTFLIWLEDNGSYVISDDDYNKVIDSSKDFEAIKKKLKSYNSLVELHWP